MSWATYNGPDSPLMEGAEEFSPMVEQVARVEKVERVQAQGKFLRRKSPQQELRESELEGRELRRKSPQSDLAESAKEGRKSPTNLELKRASRVSLKDERSSVSPNRERKRDSPRGEKMKASLGGERREEVSPLFSPIMAGHKFSPLSPEERQWAGQ